MATTTANLGLTKPDYTDTADIAVINSNMDVIDAAYDDLSDTISSISSDFLNRAYPVGSIYMSVNSTSPDTLFGGTWERITGKFLLAATDDGANGGNSNASIKPGYTGGEATHTLTPGETATKNHSHTMNHGHNFSTKAGWDTSGSSLMGDKLLYGNAPGARSVSDWLTDYSGSTGGQTAANGSAHNNMPPYLAVYMWKRTA